MSGEENNSSLPLLLTMSVAVLLAVGGGWFLLDDGVDVAPRAEGTNVAEATVAMAGGLLTVAAEAEQPQNDVEEAPAVLARVETAPVEDAEPEPVALQIDSDLRKARMAAAADMLIYPEGQSALNYYNKVIAIDASHLIAKAEREAVLARIGQTAARHLSLEEYAKAHELAVLVARENPGHTLVLDVTQHLDNLTNVIVEQAMQHAQDGNDDEVVAALAIAEQLPGRNPQYFSAVRESIANIQNSRIADEQTEQEQIRLAALQTTATWVERVRTAITEGRLISPAGESAVDYLAERDPSSEESVELTSELVGALKSTCAAKIQSDLSASSLGEAEQLLAVAERYAAEDAEIEALKGSLDDAYIAKESAQVMQIDEFVRLVSTPPRYPRRAQEREQTGWVELLFTVTATGETADIEVQEAEPANLFDAAAMAAVEQWIFEPRSVRGRLIDQRAQVKLVFQFE